MQGNSDGTFHQSNLRASEASKTPRTSGLRGVGCISASGKCREGLPGDFTEPWL